VRCGHDTLFVQVSSALAQGHGELRFSAIDHLWEQKSMGPVVTLGEFEIEGAK
jgi:hypothetical protein